MKIAATKTSAPLHLTYCLNIHPGESWAENVSAIRSSVPKIRKQVCPADPFGLGLRLSATAARTLSQPGEMAEFRDLLNSQQLYVFTINGFPYGQFHFQRVKEQVYEPDWTTAERCNYTNTLINILAHLLPPDTDGSISTVPVGFGDNVRHPQAQQQAARHLSDCVHRCAQILDDGGPLIHLGLEPEPSCLLETSQDVVTFFEEILLTVGREYLATVAGVSVGTAEEWLRRHLGVCLDTCHAAVESEDLLESIDRYESAGIRLSKIQISAALQTTNTAEARAALHKFSEPVYLHQVRARNPGTGQKTGWLDLPEALPKLDALPPETELRVHFHVPLFWTGTDNLQSTAHHMSPPFWSRIRSIVCPHLEVETYTFAVLPDSSSPFSLEDSVARELLWVAEQTCVRLKLR